MFQNISNVSWYFEIYYNLDKYLLSVLKLTLEKPNISHIMYMDISEKLLKTNQPNLLKTLL